MTWQYIPDLDRLEEQKLADKLERAYSPTQDANLEQCMEGEFSEVEEEEEQPVPNLPHMKVGTDLL